MRDPDAFPARWFLAEQRIPPLEHGFARDGMTGDVGMFVLPPFQRPFVWSEAQCVRFIESLWMGLPVASYVYNESHRHDTAYDRWLLDGQQRWTAITRYVADAFPVFGRLHSELPIGRRRQFKSIPFPCFVTRFEDEERLRDVYNRLAYGGTPHA